MTAVKLHIRNMVCSRCIMVVKSELEKLNLQPVLVQLGTAELGVTKLTEEKKNEINEVLLRYGFELIDDKKSLLIEKIKTLVIEQVHYAEKPTRLKLSRYLSENLNQDYSYLSKLFSETMGLTIEQYHIAQKIERVKELLVYNELTLSEIAYKLNYSSVAHLSAQFKKTTGLTPSFYESLTHKSRTGLEKL